MAKYRKILNDNGCLSQIAIEAYIRGILSDTENRSIQNHIDNCDLCQSALAGADQIKNAEEYSNAIDDLRTKWSEQNVESGKSIKRTISFVSVVAATIIVLFSIVALFRHQKQVRYEILAQITEEGPSIEDALLDFHVQSIGKSSSPFASRKSEDSARNEFLKSGQTQESMIPVAQIEETVIYPDVHKYDYREIVTKNPKPRQSESHQLRSPFRVMSHPPANKHYQIPDEVPEKDEIFIVVEDLPRFQEGDFLSFRKYILSNIQYPKEALNANISGRVYVQFVIDKKGNLIDAEIINSDNPIFNQEVLQVISDSPIWTPGKQRGRPVDVSLIMPVDFVLKR